MREPMNNPKFILLRGLEPAGAAMAVEKPDRPGYSVWLGQSVL